MAIAGLHVVFERPGCTDSMSILVVQSLVFMTAGLEKCKAYLQFLVFMTAGLEKCKAYLLHPET